LKRYGKSGRNRSRMVKRLGKYGRKRTFLLYFPYLITITLIFSFNIMLSFHYSTYFSSIFFLSFHYSTCLSSIFFHICSLFNMGKKEVEYWKDMENLEETQVEWWKDLGNTEERHVEQWKDKENMEANCEMIWEIWKLTFPTYFPYLLTIQLIFLPYFPYHFTIQLAFLPYFPYSRIVKKIWKLWKIPMLNSEQIWKNMEERQVE
jgi:hypothetical protein